MEEREVTLAEVLDARERRVWIQNELIREYNCPVISFTMNIAGPVKVTALTVRAFEKGLGMLREALQEAEITVNREYRISEHTGYEAFLSVQADAEQVKGICVEIEESIDIGRLFDMDVLGTDGVKLDRKKERSCIVCGREGRYCASRRIHSASEVASAMHKLLQEHFLRADAERTAEQAVCAMIEEVCTTPKPGLVDRNNTGSHEDMDIPLFVRSALSLKAYLQTCFLLGNEHREEPAELTFPYLRHAGLQAEKTMYEATAGVNTHKGALFHFGLLTGAAGRLWSAEGKYELTAITDTVRAFTQAALGSELQELKEAHTTGEKLYRQYGITGARGEAMQGYPSVREIAMPVFVRTLEEGKDRNEAGMLALLQLVAETTDTNMIRRGGKARADEASARAKELAENEKVSVQDLLDLDEYFIENHLSPGGCADLLAVTYFLYDLTRG